MPQIFLDCDGVLADFDTKAREVLGRCPREHEAEFGRGDFWTRLQHYPDFYNTLPLMPDAMRLYKAVKHLNPTILTGCPKGDWAQPQKQEWVSRYFPGVPLTMCRSADKSFHMNPGDVIIDDWPEHRQTWIDKGGVWITHTSAAESLKVLWTVYPDLRPTANDLLKNMGAVSHDEFFRDVPGYN